MTQTINIEATKAKFKKYGTWAFGLVSALLIAPFIFSIIQGLIGLIIAIVIGVVAVNLAPAFGTWVSNMKFKALTAAAEANPIETLQNSYVDAQRELEDKHKNIVAFEREVRNFDTEVEQIKDDYPDEAVQYIDISKTMHEKLQERVDKYGAYTEAVNQLEKAIKKAESIYRVATAAMKVVKLSGDAESRVFEQIKRDVAFGAVRSTLNNALAELNNAVESKIERPLVTVGATRIGSSTIGRQLGNSK